MLQFVRRQQAGDIVPSLSPQIVGLSMTLCVVGLSGWRDGEDGLRPEDLAPALCHELENGRALNISVVFRMV